MKPCSCGIFSVLKDSDGNIKSIANVRTIKYNKGVNTMSLGKEQ